MIRNEGVWMMRNGDEFKRGGRSMRIKFEEQLEELNRLLVEMGELCETAINYAVKALNAKNGDGDSMRKLTYEAERTIDDLEREIESHCMKLLMQQQPVARDLRLISAALKMISDMERIGDQALDIAEITEHVKLPDDGDFCRDHIDIMTATSTEMVTKSIQSFVDKDLTLAQEVIEMDDVVDLNFELVRGDLIDAVVAESVGNIHSTDKAIGEFFVDILMIAKYLERISDHAVNIAEWVIFSVSGHH